MILRAAIVFLLVLNLGIAAWWISGGNASRARATPPQPANVPGLRLVGETDAASAAPKATSGASPAPSAVAAAAPTAPEVIAEAAPPPAVVAAPVCLRFGPFADATARETARTALSSAGVAAVPRDSAARAARGWKVHIPPFASREDAKAMGEKIKAVGISDWYVMNEGAAANSIALGRYGSEASARRREAELKAKGIPAQAEALGDGVAQAWLDARLPANHNRAGLAAIAPSRPTECAGLR